MNEPQSINADLAGEYPIYERRGNELIPLAKRDLNRRYALTTDIQTNRTYFVQYTDAEETAANQQKSDWEKEAPAREAEAKRQADAAQKFEDALQYEKRIVAFLDILGWSDATFAKSTDQILPVKLLGKTLAQLQWIASHFNSLHKLMPSDMKWPGAPVLTQFSDSLVISVDDTEQGKGVLENALLVLTSNLIEFGFLLRGGVVRGDLFHGDNLVFGPALIEAYKLESTVASTPRVILSEQLSAEWSGRGLAGDCPWIPSRDGHLFFNFLPPFMGNPFFTDQQLWQSRLLPIRNLILNKASDITCREAVFAKYIWLAGYFDKTCDAYPNCGMEKVLHTAMQIRLETVGI